MNTTFGSILILCALVGLLLWLIIRARSVNAPHPSVVSETDKPKRKLWTMLGMSLMCFIGLLLIVEGLYHLKVGGSGMYKTAPVYWWQDIAIGVPLLIVAATELAAMRKEK